MKFVDLEKYLGKKIKVTFVDNQILEGICNTFTSRLDTDDEIYDKITIQTPGSNYVGFDESEIKTIEII